MSSLITWSAGTPISGGNRYQKAAATRSAAFALVAAPAGMPGMVSPAGPDHPLRDVAQVQTSGLQAPAGVSGLADFIVGHIPNPPLPAFPNSLSSGIGAGITAGAGPGSGSGLLLLAGLLILSFYRSMRLQSARAPTDIVLSNPVPPG
jgi:hypothetical protein